jgi:hypothetical protein
MPLDPLSELAIRHGTDKFGEHLYTPEYHRILASRRDQPLRLLEIGVGGYGNPRAGGQSLRMWAEYFPKARIVGLDLFPKSLDLPPNATIVECAQADEDALDRMWSEHGPFDVIIDDGSHQASDVVLTFNHLYPRMAPAGLYIVEDTQTAFWPEYGGAPLGTGTIMELAHRVALAMHKQEMEVVGPALASLPFGEVTASVRVLRNLLVFERGVNAFPSNHQFKLTHPEVEPVHARLMAACKTSAGPGPWIALANMELRAGRATQAALTAAEGLSRFRDEANLLDTLGRASGRKLPLPKPPPAVDAALPVLTLPEPLPAAPLASLPEAFWRVTGGNEAAAALGAEPRLTIGIAAYRRPNLIKVILHALQAQTLADFRVVVTHDGEDTTMLDVLRATADTLTIPVEYRFSAQRHADYGHTLRDRTIAECASEFLLLTNDDNYYAPPFVEMMFDSVDRYALDLVMCDMVHSHPGAGGRPVPAYSPFAVAPRRLSADIGCFIVRSALAKRVGFRDRTHDGDGTYIDDLMALGPDMVRWGKIDRTLFVHN